MAGSWGTMVVRGSLNDNKAVRMIGLEKGFTADAAAATIPDTTIEGVGGWLCGVDVEADETTPFDALTVVIKTRGGITIATNAVALTASGRILVEPPVPFAGGLIITCSGNTTNSAKGKVVPLVEG